MKRLRIAFLLATILAASSGLGAVSSADPLAAIDMNRNAIIADIVQGFDGDRVALAKRLAGLRADRLLSASLASTRESLESILAESEKSREVAVVRAGAKVLGSANSDLVYTPITPCRLIDTRGFGAPIQGGAFTPNERRAYVPAGQCGLPVAGVASMLISFTTQNLTPTSGGFLAILGPAAPVTATVDIFNFNSEWSASNTAVATGPAAQFDAFVNTASAHLVVDILGYFAPPQGTVVKSITAGAGLTGGTITDTGTIALDTPYQLPQACTNGQVPQSNGAGVWSCVTPPTANSGTVTSVASGTGLTGGPITNTGTLALATAFQLPQACTNGQIAQSNGAGMWSCVTPPTPAGGTVTAVTASPPLASTAGTTPNVSLTGVIGTTNGGTGQTSFPFGSILFGNNTGPLGAIATGFPGQVLVPLGGPPSWNDSLSLNGNLNLVGSTGGAGNILKSGTPFLYNPGLENTFLGLASGNFGVSGAGNTAVGSAALQSIGSGFRNTAVGTNALLSNNNGANNTAIGHDALISNGGGSSNTATGRGALASNSSGVANTASGAFAMSGNTGGSFNTASGFQALTSNNGDSNAAFGNFALGNNASGSNNVAMGEGALGSNTSGSNNIAIGAAAGTLLTTGSNNIDIGASGPASEAATIRIGTTPTHTRAFIAGIRGVATGIPNGITVLIDGAGQLGTVSSSRRFKDDVADMDASTDALMKLRPVTFHYKSDRAASGRTLQYGLIAEEVAGVYPGLVAHSADGEVETVMYQYLPPMLLNEHQKLRRTVQAQAARIEALEKQAERMAVALERLVPVNIVRQ